MNPQGASGALRAMEAAGAGRALMGVARGFSAVTTAATRLLGALGPVGEAIGLTVAAVVGAVTAALKFINDRITRSEQEINRIRHERSMYSGTIANAIARYDVQTRMLQMRSAYATAESAERLTESAMRLREATQERRERWENISNNLMAYMNNFATFFSKIIDQLDVISELIEAVSAGQGAGVLGGLVGAILINAKELVKEAKKKKDKAAGEMLADHWLRVGLEANMRVGDQKRHNRALPPVK
jgi:hypothetical protein